MHGKAARIRYCPATVSDLEDRDGHCLTVGRPSQNESVASQETGLADVVRSILPRGRRLCKSAIPGGPAPFRRFWFHFFCPHFPYSQPVPPSCAAPSRIRLVLSSRTQK